MQYNPTTKYLLYDARKARLLPARYLGTTPDLVHQFSVRGWGKGTRTTKKSLSASDAVWLIGTEKCPPQAYQAYLDTLSSSGTLISIRDVPANKHLLRAPLPARNLTFVNGVRLFGLVVHGVALDKVCGKEAPVYHVLATFEHGIVTVVLKIDRRLGVHWATFTSECLPKPIDIVLE